MNSNLVDRPWRESHLPLPTGRRGKGGCPYGGGVENNDLLWVVTIVGGRAGSAGSHDRLAGGERWMMVICCLSWRGEREGIATGFRERGDVEPRESTTAFAIEVGCRRQGRWRWLSVVVAAERGKELQTTIERGYYRSVFQCLCMPHLCIFMFLLFSGFSLVLSTSA